MALAFAMLLVVMSIHQVEAQKLPIWCVCDNVNYTRVLCQAALARGNFDGGSCGLDNQESYNRFTYWCKNAKDSKHNTRPGILILSQLSFEAVAPALYQMIAGPSFMKNLSADGDTSPGVIHFNIAILYDEIVIPWQT
ncbi:hypothetical protein BGZ96_001836 [Linnemannia gamsii]|uniref:Secreted protein n=1 Tax=Linnemannia gamsii TaxID=64522 RepID=A0ABQ7KBA6_9FUNG|nr:hypothetical protein BGZ96_001836 [Linnemannia gamsii]